MHDFYVQSSFYVVDLSINKIWLFKFRKKSFFDNENVFFNDSIRIEIYCFEILLKQKKSTYSEYYL